MSKRIVLLARSFALAALAVGVPGAASALPPADVSTWPAGRLLAGRTAILAPVTLERADAPLLASLRLRNLGAAAAECTVGIAAAGAKARLGAEPTAPSRYVLAGTSDADVQNTNLEIVLPEGSRAPIAVSCDQDFAAELAATGGQDTAIARASTTGAGGVVTFRQSDAFVPTRAEPSRRYAISTPAGVPYRVVTLEMDVTSAAWDADADGLHSIFWLQRGPKWRSGLIGYGNVRGPGKNLALLASNLGLRAAQMVRATDKAVILAGQDLHASYRYDTQSRRATMWLSRGGWLLTARPLEIGTTVNRVDSQAGAFSVELGFAHGGNSGPERPSYGWRYRNLEVNFIP